MKKNFLCVIAFLVISFQGLFGIEADDRSIIDRYKDILPELADSIGVGGDSSKEVLNGILAKHGFEENYNNRLLVTVLIMKILDNNRTVDPDPAVMARIKDHILTEISKSIDLTLGAVKKVSGNLGQKKERKRFKTEAFLLLLLGIGVTVTAIVTVYFMYKKIQALNKKLGVGEKSKGTEKSKPKVGEDKGVEASFVSEDFEKLKSDNDHIISLLSQVRYEHRQLKIKLAQEEKRSSELLQDVISKRKLIDRVNRENQFYIGENERLDREGKEMKRVISEQIEAFADVEGRMRRRIDEIDNAADLQSRHLSTLLTKVSTSKFKLSQVKSKFSEVV